MNDLLSKNLISTREAAELSGYTPDYLARLVRSGEVDGTRVGRSWLIGRESLLRLLKEKGKNQKELIGLVSTRAASRRSGYSPDYLARLVRSGEIDGARVGRTWLIADASLTKFLSAQAERREAHARMLAQIREKEYRAYQEPAPYAHYVEPVPFVPSSRVTTLRAFVVALLVAGTAVSAAQTLHWSSDAHVADFANEFSIAARSGSGTAVLLSAVGQAVVTPPVAVPSIARVPLVDAVVAAGERTALIVYHAINRGMASTSRFIAGLFGPRSVIVIQPSSFQGGARVSTTTTTKTVTTIIRGGGSSYNTYVQGVTKDFVYQSLSALRFDILNTVQSTMNPVTRYSDTYIYRTTVAASPSTSSIVLTTTGTGGPATFDGTTLNIPQYVGGSASFSTTSSAYWLSTYSKGFFFSTTSADHWGSTKGYLTSLSGAASSTVLADSNTWSGANTFLNTPILGSLTGLIFGNNGGLSSVATSTPTLASEFSYSGTLGALVGGASGTLSLATNGVALAKIAQIAANTILGNPTGALGNVQALATSTLGIALTDTTGVLAVARGGTASSTPLGGILVGNGSSAVKSLAIGSGLLFDGSTLSTSGAGITSLGDQYHAGLTGGSQTFATSSDTNIGLTIVSSGSQHLFTPIWSGTLADARITSAANWNTAYANRITSATAPLSIAGNIISMTQADGGTNGYLTSTDWTTFNAKQAALAFTYPLQNIANTISLAFGTTTSNTWGGTQTFTNAPRLGALSGVIYGNGGTLASVATTAPAAGAGISLSGTGAVVGGGLTITNTGVTSAQTLYGTAQTGAIKFATSSTAINNDWDITNTGTTFLFNLPTATGLVRGLLSAAKFTEFDAKQAALSFTYPLRNIANTVSLAFGTTTANSWSGLQQFNGNASTTALTVSGNTWLTSLTGVTQCLRVDANGKVSGTGSDCGTGSGGVTGVTVYGTPQTGTITLATSTTAINNDWGITNSGSTFTFNLPTANSTTRGLLSSTDWTTFNDKFATTSSAYWLSTYSKGFFFSTTSADHWGSTKGYLSAAVTAFGAQYSTLQTGASQTVASSTSGTDFKILSAGNTTTFYLPTASASARGLLSSIDWTTFNAKQAALAFTYPLQNIANTISLAFGTTTSNTWGGTQTFTNAPRLGALSGVIYGNGGTLNAVATSSITAGTGVSFAGTPGALVGGTALTITNTGVTSLAATYPLVVSGATGAVTLSTALATTTVRQQYGTNQIGALVFATSTDTNIGLNITNTGGTFTYAPTWSGVLGIARGGTASSTALGGILVGNGLSAIKSLAIGSGLSFDGTTLSSTGSSFAWPFTARSWGVSTSTTVGFLNGLLSTASSTFSSAVRFSSLAPGGAAIGAGGILYSAATTTFSSGLTYADGIVTNTGLLSIRHASGSAQTGTITLATSTTAINNDWGITNSGSTFTFNLPTANSTTRGLLSSIDWTTFNAKQAALAFTYPLQNIANTISLAFGTSTSNTWGDTQTFTNAPRLGALSGVIYGNGGTLSSVATSTPTLASEFSYSGTLGALVGGASGTLSLATNGVALAKIAQIAANTILGNPTGALGNVQALATSTLGIALTDTTGTLGIGRGGTGATSFTAGQLLYGNGTNALSSVATSSVTAGTGVSFTGTPGALVGGTALTINTPWTINGNDIYKNNSGNVGIGSTTPGTLLSLGNTGANTINISNTATSTFGYGLNLKNGCYAVNGTCLTSGSGTNYWTSAGGNIYNNTGTNVGIGSTTPWATLSVNPASQAAGVPSFVVGSSTKTDFVIKQNGYVGIGVNVPSYKLDVAGSINVADSFAYKYNGDDVIIASTTLLNYFFGGSGNFTMTGNNNVALGFQAFDANVTGNQNVGVGIAALGSNTTGDFNTAIGANALFSNTEGIANTASGPYALLSNTTGDYNSASGYKALFTNEAGDYNSANGYEALYSNVSGSSNSATGYQALYYTTGSSNLGIGYRSGYGVTSGSNNVLIGNSSIAASYSQITSGSNNIAIGNDVAVSSATASNQLNIGNLIYGVDLVGTGSTVSRGSIGLGTTTPKRRLTVASSTAPQIMLSDGGNTNSWNLRAKNSYLYFATSSPSTFATSSIAALTINPSGYVGIGVNAPGYKLDVGGYVNVSATTGYKQDGSTVLYTSAPREGTYVGIGAGNAVPTGGDNSAFGYQALYSTTGVTGINNTAIGARSLYTNLGGGSNTALGFESLYLNLSGEDNTAVGMGALYTNSTGSYNTALGKYALNLGTGSSNVALGYQAGANLTTGTNNIIIGNSVDLPSIASSNMLSIGNLIYGTGLSAYNPTSSSAVSTGRIGIGTTTPWGKFSVNPANQATGEPSFVVGSSTKTDFIVTQAGSVGVNTSRPGIVTGANTYLTVKTSLGVTNKIAAIEINGLTGSTNTVSSRLSFINTDTAVGNSNFELARIEGITDANSQTTGGLQFLTANTSNSLSVKMVIKKSGNVGVASTTPWGLLSVNPSALAAGVPAFVVGSSTATNFVVAQSGNVGIGTVAPAAKLEITGNLLFTKETARTISVGDSTSSNTAGAALSITGAAGTGTGGTGGAISITGGTGGPGVGGFTGSDGGAVTISAGSGGGFATGGALTLKSGVGLSSGTLTLQTPNVAGIAGAINLLAGNGTSSNSSGSISLTAGSHASTGAAGSISITAGSNSSSGAAGNVTINAGDGTADGNIFLNKGGVGAVGVGYFDTAYTPQSTLHVVSANTAGGNLRISTSDAYAADLGGAISFGGKMTTFDDGTNLFGLIKGAKSNGTLGNKEGYLAFSTHNGTALTERLRITSGGLVGIGTSAPEALFEVQGAEATDAVLVLDADDGDDNADTWSIKSLASTNALSILNHTTEVLNLTSAGALQIDSTLTISGVGAATSDRSALCIAIGGGLVTEDIAGNNCDTSSRRFKHDIEYLDSLEGLATLSTFKPATFVRNRPGAVEEWGFIAEDMASSARPLALYESDGVTAYSISKYAIMAVTVKALQELNARVEVVASTTTMRLDSLEDRLAMLESGAVSSASAVGSFSTATLTSALADLGITVQRGIAQFNTLVSRQFVASRDTDGTSSAASVTINAGNTYVDITNAFVHTSTKILVTFSSQVQGSWWVSEKREGGFRVTLSAPQSGDVSFDYFLVQTDGQLMTPTTATSSPAYAVTQGGGTSETYSVQGTLPEVAPTPTASASTTPSTSGEGAVVVDSATTTTTDSSDAEVSPVEAAAGEDTVIITTTTTTTTTTTVDAAPEPAPASEQPPAADPAPEPAPAPDPAPAAEPTPAPGE